MTAGDMIRRLNQQIKGWTMYHRYAVSKRIFAAVDDRIFWKLRRWCRRRHRKKSWKWIKKKYFQREGDRDWVFTGVIRDSKGKAWPIRLMKAAGVKVLRWVKIRSAANPYDPEWELYLEERIGLEADATPLQVEAGSSISGRNKGAMCGVRASRFRRKNSPGTSTIGSGAVEVAVRRSTTWSCCTPTAIGRSTHEETLTGPGCVPRGAFVKA